jgi:hypothetical protein
MDQSISNAHGITPPPELVQQWWEESNHWQYTGSEAEDYVVSMAAQWGADQELEACCAVLDGLGYEETITSDQLHAARRPKPPSLKEQALAALHGADDQGLTHEHVVAIRRALEQLDD